MNHKEALSHFLSIYKNGDQGTGFTIDGIWAIDFTLISQEDLNTLESYVIRVATNNSPNKHDASTFLQSFRQEQVRRLLVEQLEINNKLNEATTGLNDSVIKFSKEVENLANESSSQSSKQFRGNLIFSAIVAFSSACFGAWLGVTLGK